jgi:hypothetical protein
MSKDEELDIWWNNHRDEKRKKIKSLCLGHRTKHFFHEPRTHIPQYRSTNFEDKCKICGKTFRQVLKEQGRKNWKGEKL